MCNCLVFLKNRKKEINIPTISKSIQINNCDKGCIETYEWVTVGDEFEETISYSYDENLKDWFIKLKKTYENGEEKIITPKEIWNISMTTLKK
ncbi:hypothetical protein [Aquimarina algiphila]|uniref:hypothetical protein n=1 Tax=Aquimarina algiphila TaxID=2047982 RepID=UPI00232FEDE5|nr:hypothetical protein [Aquimarina algiphila]